MFARRAATWCRGVAVILDSRSFNEEEDSVLDADENAPLDSILRKTLDEDREKDGVR